MVKRFILGSFRRKRPVAAIISKAMKRYLDKLEIPFTRELLWNGGKAWKEYISRGRKRKQRIVPDFLIGAFSKVKIDTIITRDVGFYKEHFQLEVNYTRIPGD